MARQLYLHFADVHQRACVCGACTKCRKRERKRRWRLRKFLGITGPRHMPVNDGDLQARLVEKFKTKGWD